MKLSNEAQLIVTLFKERLQKESDGADEKCKDSSSEWIAGAKRGLYTAKSIISVIVGELEKRD